MPYSEELAARIKKALAFLPQTEEKIMFGGIAFMVDGKLCITIRNDRIMCRIDPLLQRELIKRTGVESVKMKGREYKGYIHVNGNLVQKDKELDYWIGLALDFNKKLKATRKK